MAFKVFVQPTLLAKVSMERKEHIISAKKEPTNPFPDNHEGKKELNGTQNRYTSSESWRLSGFLSNQ
jgi:hypothetical protein